MAVVAEDDMIFDLTVFDVLVCCYRCNVYMLCICIGCCCVV